MPREAHLLVRCQVNGLVIEADLSQLARLFDALLENAVEALNGAEGDILIQLEALAANELSSDMLRVPADWHAEDALYARVVIRDSGCGMDAEQLEQAFDPFFSTKFTGRGLGLALALAIVKPLGGCISVRSEPGQGSEFQVCLPLLTEVAVA